MNTPKFRLAQDLAALHVPNQVVHQVVNGFIQSGSQASPQFLSDNSGKSHLLIHGTAPQNGHVFFWIGQGQKFGDDPEGFVSQKNLKKWISAQGQDENTSVIGCYSGAGDGTNSEFGNSGEIEVSAPEDGSGDTLTFKEAAAKALHFVRLADAANARCRTLLADGLSAYARRLLSAKANTAGATGKGKRDIHGLPVYIEYPKGSFREKKDPQGKPWRREMKADYGRINGTQGRDGDAVDVFLGTDSKSMKAFVIDQMDSRNPDRFDEHKVVLGVRDRAAAKRLYLSNYPKGWHCGEITEMTVPVLKRWLEFGNMKETAASYAG